MLPDSHGPEAANQPTSRCGDEGTREQGNKLKPAAGQRTGPRGEVVAAARCEADFDEAVTKTADPRDVQVVQLPDSVHSFRRVDGLDADAQVIAISASPTVRQQILASLAPSMAGGEMLHKEIGDGSRTIAFHAH
ncbi:MAG: hypothetical protein GY925_05685 [Actinomycetia bacterium]|nr:hypothetical protein [Actinomycetes bacterium]